MKDVANSSDAVGYGRPPASTRFRKGRSGNPRGRPPDRKHELPYEAVLGQMVTIKENDRKYQVTAAEAFILYMIRQGLERSSAATRKTMRAIEDARAARMEGPGIRFTSIIAVYHPPANINDALVPLRMAKVLDPTRESARVALAPWIVEAALDRLGDRRLTLEEQREVYQATRTPNKVHWPDWWQLRTDMRAPARHD